MMTLHHSQWDCKAISINKKTTCQPPACIGWLSAFCFMQQPTMTNVCTKVLRRLLLTAIHCCHFHPCMHAFVVLSKNIAARAAIVLLFVAVQIPSDHLLLSTGLTGYEYSDEYRIPISFKFFLKPWLSRVNP